MSRHVPVSHLVTNFLLSSAILIVLTGLRCQHLLRHTILSTYSDVTDARFVLTIFPEKSATHIILRLRIRYFYLQGISAILVTKILKTRLPIASRFTADTRELMYLCSLVWLDM